MRAVIQEEITGCGIACVAALARVSYGEAKRAAHRLGIRAADPRLWSTTQPVQRLLKYYAIRGAKSETAFRSWETLPDLALLAVKWHKERGTAFWHWVVFVREGKDSYVLDSKKALRNHVRRDFGRIKPKWYIALRIAA